MPGVCHVKAKAYVGKDFWSLEVYLPYAAFREAARPGSGTNTVWHGNFTRHRVADQGLKPKFTAHPDSRREYTRMNTTYAKPSNNLADFAPIVPLIHLVDLFRHPWDVVRAAHRYVLPRTWRTPEGIDQATVREGVEIRQHLRADVAPTSSHCRNGHRAQTREGIPNEIILVAGSTDDAVQ